MEVRIAITPQELKDVAKQFNGKADEIRDILQFMRQQVNSMEGSWEGAAKNAYFANFEEMARMFDQLPEGVDNTATTLETIAQNMIDADNSMANG